MTSLRQIEFIENLKYRKPADDLDKAVIEKLDNYFIQLEGRKPLPLQEMVTERIEKIVVTYALIKTGCNFSKAAELLGIHRNTLHTRMLKLKIFEDESLLRTDPKSRLEKRVRSGLGSHRALNTTATIRRPRR